MLVLRCGREQSCQCAGYADAREGRSADIRVIARRREYGAAFPLVRVTRTGQYERVWQARRRCSLNSWRSTEPSHASTSFTTLTPRPRCGPHGSR